MFNLGEFIKYIAIIHIIIFTVIIIYTVIIVRLTNGFINIFIGTRNNNEILVKNINSKNIESSDKILGDGFKRFIFYTGFFILVVILLLIIFKLKHFY